MKQILHTSVRQNFSNKGFTLIELLVVVGIIGILGAIAIPMYNGYIRDAKIKSARATLEQFPVLLEQYRAENGRMCPVCNVTGIYTYRYRENNNGGVIPNNLTLNYPDFQAKGTTAAVSPYEYSISIFVAGCPACIETATFTAIAITSRNAPAGNITSNLYQ